MQMLNTREKRKVFLFTCMVVVSNMLFGQVIVLDPGHNYDDIVTGYRSETEVLTNWDVANKTKALIETYTGWSVFLTRENNDPGPENHVSLSAREDIANQLEAASPGEVLFLSIHCNAGGGTGSETFFCNKTCKSDSLLLHYALNVQQKMVITGAWRDRRCVEDATYLGFHLGVLDGLMMPNALNEIGFVDHPYDAAKLLDNNWRACFALAYLEAFHETFGIEPETGLPECSPTRVEENHQRDQIRVFPNPCHDHVNIEISKKPRSLSVFSTDGRRFHPKIKISHEKITINMTGLPSGIFIIRVNTGDRVFNTFCLRL